MCGRRVCRRRACRRRVFINIVLLRNLTSVHVRFLLLVSTKLSTKSGSF